VHEKGESHPSPTFKQYVSAQRGGAPDPLSRRQVRVYQLYSRTSGKHVQIPGPRVSATAEDGDVFGEWGGVREGPLGGIREGPLGGT